MANDTANSFLNDKKVKKRLNQINQMIGRANLEIYGTDRNSDVDDLNKKFHQIMHSEIDSISGKEEGDTSSFLAKIVSKDNKINAIEELLSNQFSSEIGGDMQMIQTFFYDQYKNKLLEQSDLHQISTTLIELSEAIDIMRDAIVSSNIVDGKMARTLSFEGSMDETGNIDIVELMEEKFKLQDKIKNFVVPNTLEYGEYYIYVVPYAKIFQDFMSQKDKAHNMFYRENTVYIPNKKNPTIKSWDTLFTESFEAFKNDNIDLYSNNSPFDKGSPHHMPTKDEYVNEMKGILSHIEVSNDPIPIPVLEEGYESMVEYMDTYIHEAGDNTNPTRHGKTPKVQEDLYASLNGSESITSDGRKLDKKRNEFSEIRDCYVKVMEPLKVIPVKVMDSVIGYYYVQEEEIKNMASGNYTNGLYFTKFTDRVNNRSIIDTLCKGIVSQFDKKFLIENAKFKKQIADVIQYYNYAEKRLKFQFIPVEYMVQFKIDVDEYGDGQSMLKKSLFYAKLYLMLLLFKIMSIVLYSNDQKVNYIRQSGIDKNIANRIEEIARQKQNRQINILDMFSYTTLINKVGAGNEMYVPVGRSGERPIETEILQGQDIQLNSDLLEMLKNAYILGTGVPQAILNYLNEAEFAKVIEQNNTKMNARVVNYQLDLNESITDLYKRIMRWSTTLDETDIENFSFAFQPPKLSSGNTKSEAIQAFQTYSDFLRTLLFKKDEEMTAQDVVTLREFTKLLAKDQLPMINFDTLEEFMEKSTLEAKKELLKPNPENGDDDLDEDLNNMPDEG